MADREAQSNYFRVEIRLRHAEDWTPAERATYFGLLQQAAESNGSGAIRLFIDDLISIIGAFNFNGKRIVKQKVLGTIDALAEREAVIKVNADWLFIPDFWGMGHSVSNTKHRISIERTLNGLPKDVERIFWETYSLDEVGQKKKQKKKQLKNPTDSSSPAVAGGKPLAAERELVYLEDAAKFCKMVDEAKAYRKWNVPTEKNSPAVAARELRLLVEQDGFKAGDLPKLLKAFHWALYKHTGTNGFCWGKVLLGVGEWRSNNKLLKMYDDWKESTEPSGVQSDPLRREIASMPKDGYEVPR